MVTPRHIDLEGNWLRMVKKCLQTLGVLAPYWLNVSTYGCWGLFMRWQIAFLGAGFSGTLVGYPIQWIAIFPGSGASEMDKDCCSAWRCWVFLNPTLMYTAQRSVHVETQYMTLYNYIEINIHAHTCITWHDMTWHDRTCHAMTWHDMTLHMFCKSVIWYTTFVPVSLVLKLNQYTSVFEENTLFGFEHR